MQPESVRRAAEITRDKDEYFLYTKLTFLYTLRTKPLSGRNRQNCPFRALFIYCFIY